MLPRPLSEIYENIRDFFVVRNGEQITACGALHVAWEDLAEIKSLAVSRATRRRVWVLISCKPASRKPENLA
jgi:amino-acid N-acetyltransferase